MDLKLLVISDTHGYIGNAVSLIEELNPEYVIHLGDMAADCDELHNIYPMRRIICVLGNNDWYCKSYPCEIITEIGGKKFFICHGHKYNVKYGLQSLKAAARAQDADIALFGHTHCRHLETSGPLTVMNPGSRSSYGLIEINENGEIKAEIKDV